MKTLDQKYVLLNVITRLKLSVEKYEQESVICLPSDLKRNVKTVTCIRNEAIRLDTISITSSDNRVSPSMDGQTKLCLLEVHD